MLGQQFFLSLLQTDDEALQSAQTLLQIVDDALQSAQTILQAGDEPLESAETILQTRDEGLFSKLWQEISKKPVRPCGESCRCF